MKLPESFTELYARLRDARGLGGDDVDHGAAVCLLTGRVLHAGAKDQARRELHVTRAAHQRRRRRRLLPRAQVRGPLGAGPHASYAPSIYVDDHGEYDVGLRRGAPLRLHAGRVAALGGAGNTHGVAREVARPRAVVARDPGQRC